jgi:uncharacterized protein
MMEGFLPMPAESPRSLVAGSILDDLIGTVLESLAGSRAGVTVKDIRVGVFYTGVKLSTGHGGVAYTPSEDLPLEHAARHSYMPKAGSLQSLPIADVAGLAHSDNLLESAVGLATVNALAEMRYADGLAACRTIPDADAVDTIGVASTDTVTMVGAFPFIIRKLQGNVARLYVTERNPQAYSHYPLIPAERQEEVLTTADVVLITAETLVNHTLDAILPLCTRARAIALIGPTTPLCPEPLFSRGVTVVGGTHITDSDMMLRVIGEGGTGGPLWARGATKLNLVPA